jgi:UDP-N-acetylglucosamine 2-epimerase (non-hydrolysing)
LPIVSVVGARPNFVKMAPVIDALERRGFSQRTVHTGQHYDPELTDDVLVDVGFPQPDIFLGIGSGSHGEQTGRALIALDGAFATLRPSLVIVGGDVNSTLAAALAAAKLQVPVAHVEAGLRCDDWTMPEEINRVLTDRLSSLLFTHSPEASENLSAEGIDPHRTHYVGNTMIDSLRRLEPRARRRAAWLRLSLRERSYILVTLHRPTNVDVPHRLLSIVEALLELARSSAVVFPMHPRTRARLAETHQLRSLSEHGVHCLDPLGYLDFLSLELAAGAVVTDSGGVQEETTALGVRCYTLRPNTERPITIERGTNTLLGEDPAALLQVRCAPAPPVPCEIPLWDGRAAERIADIIETSFAEGIPLIGPGRRRTAPLEPEPHEILARR